MEDEDGDCVEEVGEKIAEDNDTLPIDEEREEASLRNDYDEQMEDVEEARPDAEINRSNESTLKQRLENKLTETQ